MIERELDIPLRLEWKVICDVACHALIMNISFNEACLQRLRNFLIAE